MKGKRFKMRQTIDTLY